jgi:prepilin-type N-terminal cleavage/methylation domain-containing protein
MTKFTRRAMTLIEIIIVIFLIGLIAGVIGYNLTGTLEKGKAFATEQGMKRLHETLELAISEKPELLDNIETEWQNVVKNSPYVKDPNAIIHDGWGTEFDVTVENDQIIIRYKNLEKYQGGGG